METIRQPIYGVLLIATTLLLVLNIFLAGYTLEDDNKLLMSIGLSTMLLSGMFLAVFSATGVISREIENKTVLTVISKPVGRPVFLLGKFGGVIGAQILAFYICFLVFVLCTHHKVLQYSSDPFDWPAILFGGGSIVLSLVVAAALNFFYGKEFASVAVAMVVPMLTVGTLITACFDREFNSAPIIESFVEFQMHKASLLLLFAVLMISAVALAASTRFGQVMTLMICTMFMIVGFLLDWFLGPYSGDRSVLAGVYRVLPNLNMFWVEEATTAGIDVPNSYILFAALYAFCFMVAFLAIGVAMFQRREVG